MMNQYIFDENLFNLFNSKPDKAIPEKPVENNKADAEYPEGKNEGDSKIGKTNDLAK
jgi:hypothetical protein